MNQAAEYVVTFKDIETIVSARDAEEAQDIAIQQVEAAQGYTTEIVRIIRRG
ncbi:hypothetical protein [Burkholderia multivorans]|uniref:hypothetical protein n=1 Tax=Burkholderia multivorans TaxID=87883 RepID=UPI000A65FFD5|nr:hypothetical protein [Burkholderia multivorans]